MPITPDMNAVIVNKPDNPPMVAMGFAPVIEQAHYVSHDFSDPSTWYQKSVRHMGRGYSRDAANEYSLSTPLGADETLICADMGKINQEDVDPAVIPHKFLVYVDGVQKKVAGLSATAYPDTSNWDDYGYEVEVDWTNGSLKFKVDPGVSAVVTADFSAHDTNLTMIERSKFCVQAPRGKVLRVLKAETQFSKSIDIKDTVIFTGSGYVSYTAIQTDASYDPGLSPVSGFRVRIDDAANLHSNFNGTFYNPDGTPATVGDGDILEYRNQRGWGILFDASENSGVVVLELDEEGNPTAQPYQLWDGVSYSPTTPSPIFKKETYGVRKAYKRLSDYLNETTGNYPVLAGGFIIGSRGQANDTMQLPWNWVGTSLVKDSEGAELCMFLQHGIPFEGPAGSHVTTTFYCQVIEV